jgi:hypothetical protein
MTQQVRTGCRKHRKAAWGLALVCACILAVVAIPLASGATSGDRPTTYTFTGSTAACAGQGSLTFDVTLTNTSKTQNLGSADLSAPANITVTAASITSGGGAAASIAVSTYPYPVTPDTNDPTSVGRSLVSLRNLQAPGGQTPSAAVIVHVTANVVASGKQYWYSLVKQANEFKPGDLDLSNRFNIQGSNPYVDVETCTLAFTQQPPNPWQKATKASSAVAVALEAGTTPVPSSGLNPSLAANGAGTTSDFDFGVPSYDSTSFTWTWPDAMPKATAPSGLYNLVATATGSSATSDSDPNTAGIQPFQVADSVCPAGQNCPPAESNTDPNAEGAGALGINNTLSGPVTLDFGPGGGEAKCSPWNRAFYTDGSGTTVYFPSVVLNYNWGQKMLQVTYLVRNSEWVLTNVSRGNQDIEFCVGARHQVNTQENGDPATNSSAVPFTGKYGPATWKDTDQLFWGVISTVSNPNKVTTDPAVCARGTVDLSTGVNGATEKWRSWTICIPYDWDFSIKGG